MSEREAPFNGLRYAEAVALMREDQGELYTALVMAAGYLAAGNMYGMSAAALEAAERLFPDKAKAKIL